MLLETVFTIYMTGLLVHVGDSATSKEHLIVIDDRDHMPLVVIPKEADAGSNPQTHVIRLQKGDFITFTGLPSGDAHTNAAFDTDIVSLQEMLNGGDIDDDVRYNRDHAEVIASMEYPEGTLSPSEWFTKEAVVTAPGKTPVQKCLAKVVRFVSMTDKTKVTLKISNSTNSNNSQAKKPIAFALKPNAEILIGNVAWGGAGHFHKYQHLATTSTGIGTIAESTTKCAKATAIAVRGISPEIQKILIADQPECTNTDWP